MREFTVGGDGLTLANQAVTLVNINPAAAPSVNIEVFRMWASQQGSATSAQQRVQVVTQASVFPTLVSATPRALKFVDAVSTITGGTAGAAGNSGINASAEGAGTKVVRFGDNFNVLNGYLWVSLPQEAIVQPAGATSSLSLFLPAAAASLTNWGTGMNFREV